MEPGSSEFTPPSEVKNNGIKFNIETIANPLHPDRNEDYAVTGENYFLVLDGVSGASGNEGGDKASRLAGGIISQSIEAMPKNLTPEEIKDHLVKSFKLANDKLNEKNRTEKTKIGTTCSALVFWESPSGENKAIICSLGDSRVCRLRDGKLEQLTLDDSLLTSHYKGNIKLAKERQLAFSNVINPEELITTNQDDDTKDNTEFLLYKKKNIITQGLGLMEEEGEYLEIEPRIEVCDVRKGDKFIGGTDGWSDVLTHNETEDRLNLNPDSKIAAKIIVNESKDRGVRGKANHPRAKCDDITFIIAEVNSSQENKNQPVLKSEFDPNSKNLKVKRSDGTTDDGWSIYKFDEASQIATLSKMEDGRLKTKTSLISTIEKLNS